jgi:Asp/Glu/hydantoin racemase
MHDSRRVPIVDILLINPNTAVDTTTMMVEIARAEAPEGVAIRGATAARGVSMILSPPQLHAAGAEVLASARAFANEADGIIVSAFGDPGLSALRASTDKPVVGICEAAVLEGARHGRRFGIATVTPELAELIEAKIAEAGVAAYHTGIRLTQGDPLALAADPEKLREALALAVAECIERDGAQAVVIGGGPLGQAARSLAPYFGVPIIAPIPAAMRLLLHRLGTTPVR